VTIIDRFPQHELDNSTNNLLQCGSENPKSNNGEVLRDKNEKPLSTLDIRRMEKSVSARVLECKQAKMLSEMARLGIFR
jgi:hypothetical protein